MAVIPPFWRSLGNRVLAPFVLSEREVNHLPVVIAAVRILFGLLIMHRMLDIFGFAMLPGGLDPRMVRLVSAVACMFGAMLTLGVATPLALIGLLAAYALHPLAFNLGTLVSMALLWGLLLLGAGRSHSVDAHLLRSRHVGPWLARLYASFGATDPRRTAGIRLMMLALFWGNCLNAMLYHVSDPFWLKGQVLALVFTAPYLSDHHGLMAALRDQYPRAFMAFCQLGIGIQAMWEAFLLPLMYLRWARPFVVVQGLGFFGVSVWLLNLQYLPLVELLFWTLLFGPAALGWMQQRRTGEARPALAASAAPPAMDGRVAPAVVALACFTVVLHTAVSPTLVPGPFVDTALAIRQGLRPLFRLFGRGQVNVLNQPDVAMNNAYMVLQEVDEAGRHLRAVPYQDIDGGRLDYLRNDSLYFNHSLRWQRNTWARKFIDGDPSRPGGATIQVAFRVALLDAVLTDSSRAHHYMAHIYVRHMDLATSPPRWTAARRVSSIPITLTAPRLAPFHQLRWPTFNLPPGQAFSGDRLARTEAILAQEPKTPILRPVRRVL